MVNLQVQIVLALFFYVIPFHEKSVRVFIQAMDSHSMIINDTMEKEFDFRKVLQENSMFKPFVDKCPLRIYGGNAVSIEDIPYQIVIRLGSRRGDQWRLICGGSIITNLYILTAAHCFERPALRILRRFRVVAGTSQSSVTLYGGKKTRHELLEKIQISEVWRKIKYCFSHARYNARRITNDFAVLQLESPLAFSKTIQPIPMLRTSHGIHLLDSMMCLVSGYGLMDYRIPSPTLRMVCVPLVESSKCSKYYGRNSISNSQFCAGERGKDSCQGDSGGPITYKGYLIGIVSWGGQCAKAPGVYTLVSAYTTGQKIPFRRGHSATICADFIELFFLVFLIFLYNFTVTVRMTRTTFMW